LSRFEAEEDQDDGMDATDADRRKASELSVNLFEVKDTGSGGRILVKDVERAAKQPADSG
jgi:pyruvate/2-oxoglutarate dehydrogenase complex dihydrolipoamide acyltransferase (E2) component